MEYSTAREIIQSGDLLAWSGRTFFSRLIKIFTSSNITHVGIAWRVGMHLFVIESIEGKGVRLFPLSGRVPFFWLRPSNREHSWNPIVEETAFQKIGEKYSLMDCIRAFFKRRLKKDKYWQCAEFASYLLSLMGYETNGYNTPHILVQRMLEKNCVLVKVTKKK
jgi:hypothetical protein